MENKRPGLLRRFGGFLWRTLNGLRRLVFNLLFLAVLILIVVGVVSEEGPTVPANGALVINPSGVLVDQLSYNDPFSGLISGDNAPAETLLSDLIKAIDIAGDAPSRSLSCRSARSSGQPAASVAMPTGTFT